MAKRDDEQTYYVCGRCLAKQFHLVSEEPKIPCDTCGYEGKDRKYTVLPAEVKLDLSQY